MTPSADTRSQIMAAFGEQLATLGYQGVSLVGVARTVGIQKPSIYHHFPGGKEEIFSAVALRFIEQLGDRMTAAIAIEGSTEEKLRALAVASAEHSPSAISFEQRIYDALNLVSEQTRNDVSQKYVSGLLDPVVALFAKAVETGDIAGDPWFLMNAFLHLARAPTS
ncbi:TetR/AcrR family transcriptional regulator [Salinispora arenicola]|uniref:TetR/AcrR family transcriptional regulator n=1 Tax=Salinispora arenicola TaxID=168697 RepID=UPI0027DD19D9|nr:TetR/AcrR family transcriptional regulator [Salinispora arenicola]